MTGLKWSRSTSSSASSRRTEHTVHQRPKYAFNSIEQVQAIADDWLIQYNEYRPHDSLGGVPPKQFMLRLITTTAADSGNQLPA
ncbi:integrase core domain-containing protein [Roseateles sp. MS654]|uniref:integrase core domain-containing protein n=1 Tax=Roseateles sp. MS654 TaxID=3412685 RepID=UPI003C2D0C2D